MTKPTQANLFGPLFTEVKKDFLESLDKGDSPLCPCCGRRAKRYKRPLNSGVAGLLAHLWLRYRNLVPFNFEQESRSFAQKYGTQARDAVTLMRYYKFIERTEHKGEYIMTEKAGLFATQQIRVPNFVISFADRVEGFSGAMIGIRAVLSNRFDYDELMRTRVEWTKP